MPENPRWLEIANHQRRTFNALADVFDAPQPPAVMDRLQKIVAAADIQPGEAVLDIGTGAGVLLPLIQQYEPSHIVACDVAEQMLNRVHCRFPSVLALQADVVQLPLKPASVDVVFLNAMYGNIADKPAACAHVARVLRSGGRMVVSHPEGREFIEQLRATSNYFLESFPKQKEFEQLLQPLGLQMTAFREEPNLYLMIARKGGNNSKPRELG